MMLRTDRFKELQDRINFYKQSILNSDQSNLTGGCLVYAPDEQKFIMNPAQQEPPMAQQTSPYESVVISTPSLTPLSSTSTYKSVTPTMTNKMEPIHSFEPSLNPQQSPELVTPHQYPQNQPKMNMPQVDPMGQSAMTRENAIAMIKQLDENVRQRRGNKKLN